MKTAMNEAERHALEIVRTLREDGHEAYFAGGAVRDRLLGIEPKDVDVATDAPPVRVAELFPGSEAVGKAFGVTLVKHAGGCTEVARFRMDGPYEDGRRPSYVKPATVKEDVARRDFTINGMFYDPLTDTLHDWVDGRKDLEAGIIRAIGDQEARFTEDYLRLFRAVRFAARLNFRIDDATWVAIQRNAKRTEKLAPERVCDELTRIFTGPNSGKALRLLADSGLLDAWLPEVAALRGVEQPDDYHPEGDVFEHTIRVLDALENPGPALGWAAVLHDIGKPRTKRIRRERITFYNHEETGAEMARRVGRRLLFSNELMGRVAALIAEHLYPLNYMQMREATKRRFLARPFIDDHLALYRADRLGSSGDLLILEAIQKDLSEKPDLRQLPEPLLTGEDLIAMGYPPGPLFTEILSSLMDAQLEGTLADADSAKRWVQKRWSQLQGCP